jgi:hypothetical protein
MIDRRDVMVDGRIIPVMETDESAIELRASTLVFMERRHRARCSRCDVRRVLYRVGIRTIMRTPEFTEARCAACWGIKADES